MRKPTYTLEQMQNDILQDFADYADEAGMNDIADELRELAGEDLRQACDDFADADALAYGNMV